MDGWRLTELVPTFFGAKTHLPPPKRRKKRPEKVAKCFATFFGLFLCSCEQNTIKIGVSCVFCENAQKPRETRVSGILQMPWASFS